MKTRVFTTALVVTAAVALTAAAQGSAPRSALGDALRSPDLSLGKTGALAIDLRTGATVFQHNDEIALAPASNEKIPVSWVALKHLGPAYRFHTEVFGVGSRAGMTWRGDLVLKGFGDPTLTSRDIDTLAGTVAASGIRTISGRILGDESFYDKQRAAPGWKRSFLGLETPPLSALVVDRARGWPALSPPLLAARAFREALVRHGVAVGRAGLGRTPSTAVPIATDISEPLWKVIRRMNRQSDNFTAEMVLKQLAASTGMTGTSAAGSRIVMQTMAEGGIPVAGVRIVDGSGLSSLNRLTAKALVAVLRAGFEDLTIHKAFVDSLSVAGQNGTLSRRLAPLTGEIKAKTGTTNIACTLSGFVRDRVVFAVLQNGSPVAYWSARAAQDRFVTLLAVPAVG